MPRIDFIGKGDVAGHHLGVPFHGLKIDKSKSVGNADIDDNLIIQGDNLLALKALLPRYAGKVKCIYIDPPYNTGNEGWVYNDKVNSPTLKNWYKKVVGGDDQCRHDKWLCMMYPRLQLLKELLSDDGVIFISCDDNEQHRLRFIMDEVFGEENFVENFTVRANPRGNQAKRLTASEHEYVISCAKNKSLVSPLSFEKSKEEFKKKDKNGYYRELGLRKRGAGARRQDAENQYYPIYFNKDTEEISTKNKKNFIKILPYLSNGEEGRWRWSKSNVEENKDRLMVRLVNRRDSDKSYDVFEKEYFSENRKTKIKSILYEKWVNYENATEELKIIFGKEKVFDYTKPHLLIKELLKAATEQGDIILDSFAGSGTTAHATLALNKEDGGNRKFILVECEDYANKIAAERIRRVIKGVPTAKDENLKKGLGGTFTYATLGEEIDPEKILSGEMMPSWETLATHVFWLATGKPLETKLKQNKENFIGKYKNENIYLLYKPDVAFMQSNKAALVGSMVDELGAQCKKGERTIYFAACAYPSQKDLSNNKITFCQLPWAITKQVIKKD